MNKQEIIEEIKEQILKAESFGIDGDNPHEAVHLSINEAKMLIQSLTTPTSESKVTTELDVEDIKEMACDYVFNMGGLPKDLPAFQKALYDFYNATQSNTEAMREHAIGFLKFCDRSFTDGMVYSEIYEDYLTTLTK